MLTMIGVYIDNIGALGLCTPDLLFHAYSVSVISGAGTARITSQLALWLPFSKWFAVIYQGGSVLGM